MRFRKFIFLSFFFLVLFSLFFCLLPVSDRSPAQASGRVVRFWNVENAIDAPRSRVRSAQARDVIGGPGPRVPSGRPVLSAECCHGILFGGVFFGVGAVAAMEGGGLER